MRRGFRDLRPGLEMLRSSHLKNAEHTPKGVSPEYLFPRTHHRCMCGSPSERKGEIVPEPFSGEHEGPGASPHC